MRAYIYPPNVSDHECIRIAYSSQKELLGLKNLFYFKYLNFAELSSPFGCSFFSNDVEVYHGQ